jgi:hypothetical protein
VVETEMHLFSWEVNHHTVAWHAYKADATAHAKSHHFHFLTFQPSLLFATHCATPVSHSMAKETAHDLRLTDKPTDDEAQSDSGMESVALMTSSSPTLAVVKMADGQIPELLDFFKKTIVTEEERQDYHDFDWLSGNLLSTIPTIHDSTVI